MKYVYKLSSFSIRLACFCAIWQYFIFMMNVHISLAIMGQDKN